MTVNGYPDGFKCSDLVYQAGQPERPGRIVGFASPTEAVVVTLEEERETWPVANLLDLLDLVEQLQVAAGEHLRRAERLRRRQRQPAVNEVRPPF